MTGIDDVRANLAADEELQRRGESAMEMGLDISQLSEGLSSFKESCRWDLTTGRQRK